MGKQSADASHDIVQIQHDQPGDVSGYSYRIDQIGDETSDNLSIDGFLRRPVKILDFYWELGVAPFVTLDPWSLFLEDPRVMNRLAHFKNFRGKLHVEFSLSANIFYYGKLIAMYTPFPDVDNLTICRQGVIQDVIEGSQRPHVLLDANTSKGGVLECPFIHKKNSIDITGGEYRTLGNINIVALNSLRHVNNGTQPVHVVAYAWLAESQFSTPTTVLPTGLQPQGVEEKLDRVHNKISAVRSYASSYINALATGSEMAMKIAMGLNYILGFSRPLVIAKDSVVVRFHSWLSSTNTNRFAKNLALDAHKEITVDPRVVGIDGIDEMAFSHLVTKECFLCQFDMNSSQSNGTILWNSRVSPINYDIYDDEVHMTPSAWVGSAFKYWRGSMKYRFQAVCSPMHRARIRIVWDPLYIAGKSTIYNTAYSRIIDVSSETDEEITIRWGQNTSYLLTSPLSSTDKNFSKDAYTNSIPDFFNGVIAVYVINSLSSPNEEEATISFNVYCQPDSDTEFCELDITRSVNKAFYGSVVPADLLPPYYTPPNPGSPNDPVSRSTASAGSVLYESYPAGYDNWRLTGNPSLNGYEQRMLVDGSATYEYLYYANGTSNTQELELENPSANAGTFSITVNGVTNTINFPANNIGGTGIVQFQTPGGGTGWQKVSIVTTNTVGSRLWVKSITNQLPSSLTKTFKSGDEVRQIVGTRAGSNGLFQYNVSGGAPFTIKLQGVKLGTMVSMVIYSPCVINGISYNGTYPGTVPPASTTAKWIHIPNITSDTLTVTPLGGTFYGGGLTYFSEFGPQGIEQANSNGGAGVIENMTMDCGATMDSEANKVFFGEQIASWRTVLKRTHAIAKHRKKLAGRSSIVICSGPDKQETISDVNYDVTPITSLFAWVERAYLGKRGSYLHSIVPLTRHANSDLVFSYQRLPTEVFQTTATENFNTATTLTVPNLSMGYELDINAFTGIFEIIIPWYSRYRFNPGRQTGRSEFDMYYKLSCNSPAETGYTIGCSAHEDYSLSCFVCTPIVLIS